MKELMHKWRRHSFSSGTTNGDDFKQFFSEFKTTLKRECKKLGIEVIPFKINHYCFTGFVKKDGKYIYFSVGDVRYDGVWFNRILYRTAKHEKDWTGGGNNWTTLENLVDDINNYF